MITSNIVRNRGSLRSLTMTFIPMTDDSAVIGSVTAAMTARRSAAIVILVCVWVWKNAAHR
jgi:hypothetical protein